MKAVLSILFRCDCLHPLEGFIDFAHIDIAEEALDRTASSGHLSIKRQAASAMLG